ncbi:MAG: hypothetical protein M1814_000620 [Vezdaea aestivalis]|nr:MAG: hypothetical protein M1814_000620 [Vezdaea aestivalis]
MCQFSQRAFMLCGHLEKHRKQTSCWLGSFKPRWEQVRKFEGCYQYVIARVPVDGYCSNCRAAGIAQEPVPRSQWSKRDLREWDVKPEREFDLEWKARKVSGPGMPTQFLGKMAKAFKKQNAKRYSFKNPHTSVPSPSDHGHGSSRQAPPAQRFPSTQYDYDNDQVVDTGTPSRTPNSNRVRFNPIFNVQPFEESEKPVKITRGPIIDPNDLERSPLETNPPGPDFSNYRDPPPKKRRDRLCEEQRQAQREHHKQEQREEKQRRYEQQQRLKQRQEQQRKIEERQRWKEEDEQQLREQQEEQERQEQTQMFQEQLDKLEQEQQEARDQDLPDEEMEQWEEEQQLQYEQQQRGALKREQQKTDRQKRDRQQREHQHHQPQAQPQSRIPRKPLPLAPCVPPGAQHGNLVIHSPTPQRFNTSQVRDWRLGQPSPSPPPIEPTPSPVPSSQALPSPRLSRPFEPFQQPSSPSAPSPPRKASSLPLAPAPPPKQAQIVIPARVSSLDESTSPPHSALSALDSAFTQPVIARRLNRGPAPVRELVGLHPALETALRPDMDVKIAKQGLVVRRGAVRRVGVDARVVDGEGRRSRNGSVMEDSGSDGEDEEEVVEGEGGDDDEDPHRIPPPQRQRPRQRRSRSATEFFEQFADDDWFMVDDEGDSGEVYMPRSRLWDAETHHPQASRWAIWENKFATPYARFR